MITIKPAIESDAERLAEIQKQAFLPLYEKYHDQGSPYLRGTEDILRRLNTPIFRYFTILYDNNIIGGILYKCQGRGIFFDNLGKSEYYLQRVFITPVLQSKGVASTAIRL